MFQQVMGPIAGELKPFLSLGLKRILPLGISSFVSSQIATNAPALLVPQLESSEKEEELETANEIEELETANEIEERCQPAPLGASCSFLFW